MGWLPESLLVQSSQALVISLVAEIICFQRRCGKLVYIRSLGLNEKTHVNVY